MLRLTGNDRAVAEIAAVAEHVAGVTTAAAGLRLECCANGTDVGRQPLVTLPDRPGESDVESVWSEIQTWATESLGRAEVPTFWRALAHQPRLLQATWRKDRVVMSEGVLTSELKACVALAVAQFRQSGYWIDYYSEMLRVRHAFDDAALVEIAGATMHYASFNSIAHGMRLAAPVEGLTSADVAVGGPREHLVPGVRRGVASR